MKHSTSVLLLASTTLSVNSLNASAHAGEHTHHTFEWLGHMMTSSHHLLALAGTALLLATGSLLYKNLKRSKLTRRHNEDMKSLSDH